MNKKFISDKTTTRSHQTFDRIIGSILGAYKEVFNAWNPVVSKFFTSLKEFVLLLAKAFGLIKANSLNLQLIPIKPDEKKYALKNKN